MESNPRADELGSLIATVFPKNAASVLEALESKHAIATKAALLRVLSDAVSAQRLPERWRVRITNALAIAAVQSALLAPDAVSSGQDFGGVMKVGWRPNGEAGGPTLLVMQGDLTKCRADAVVNPANSQLSHGGGLAAAIVKKGSFSIQIESDKWTKLHGTLDVGAAMSTTAGKLPCKRIIHTVGPKIGRKRLPTDEEADQLRQAVASVLDEGVRLGLASVAIPGISTGSFRYPVDLGATQIVRECVRFCRSQPRTTLQTILLMNIDDATVLTFVKALEDAVQRAVIAKACQ